MNKDLLSIQETIAHLQAEIASMNDEIYAQQQDITRLKAQVIHLNGHIKSLQDGDGILNPEEDQPPPHY